MKRILIFSLDYLPGTISGAEAAIQEITDRMSPEEIEFHMVTLYYDSAVPRTGEGRAHPPCGAFWKSTREPRRAQTMSPPLQQTFFPNCGRNQSVLFTSEIPLRWRVGDDGSWDKCANLYL